MTGRQHLHMAMFTGAILVALAPFACSSKNKATSSTASGGSTMSSTSTNIMTGFGPVTGTSTGSVMCEQVGAACTGPIDCCSGTCLSGVCNIAACTSDHAMCTANGQCCSGNCANGACV